MSLRALLLLAIAYVLLVAIVAFEVPLAVHTSERIDSEVRAQAAAQADLLAVAAIEELPEGREHLQPLTEVAAETVRGRVIVVDERGGLLADSGGEPTGTAFATRPEIEAALSGDRFQGQRPSQDLGVEIIATATPMVAEGEVRGAVRITQSTEAERRAVLDAFGNLVLIGLIVLIIGLIAAAILARQLATPLHAMTASAEQIAAGDLDERVPPTGSREQRALARSLNEMTDRLAGALRAQRQFVADASHQLRTPLAGMRLRLEEADAALDGSAGGTAAREELEGAIGEVDRLSDIVDDMLTLSRAGERSARAEAVRPVVLADAAVERWRGDALARQIDLVRTGDDHDVTVSCSPADVDQVLDVLIDNAIRYSPPSTAIRVEAGVGRIAVIDEGPGVSPEEREAVFERFHRGGAGRAGPPGTGLGLSIARELARVWGAEVALASASEGRGTVASVQFATTGKPTPSEVGER